MTRTRVILSAEARGIIDTLALDVTDIGHQADETLVYVHLSQKNIDAIAATLGERPQQPEPAKEEMAAQSFGSDELDYVWNILDHKRLVMLYLHAVTSALFKRAALHDYTKFGPEEFWAYAQALPRFQAVEYGSPEYMEVVRSIKPAIQHHVTNNRHHPECFPNGVNDMTLVDLVEMVCDWIAASQRVPGDRLRLDLNKDRFGLGDQLYGIIQRTVEELAPHALPPAPTAEESE